MTQSALDTGRVEFADHIERVGIVLEGLIAMGEAFGDVDPALVSGGKLNRDMLENRSATPASGPR